MQVKTVWESDSISPRYARKLERSRIRLNLYDSSKNHRSRSRWKLVYTVVLQTQGDDRCQLHCPSRHPSRDMNKRRLLYIKTHIVMRTGGITAMPRSMLRSENNLVSEPHVQTNGKPAPFFFVQTSNGRFRIFSDRCVGRISTNKKKRQAFLMLVGESWNPCKKSHPETTNEFCSSLSLKLSGA